MSSFRRCLAILSVFGTSAIACTESAERPPGTAGSDAESTGGTAGAAGAGGAGGTAGSEVDAQADASGGTDASADTGADGADGSADANGGSAGDHNDAGTDANGCNCSALEECWNGTLCVAKSVPVPGGYAIDATEVTRAQYMTWWHLFAHPIPDQPPFCLWNESLYPNDSCMPDVSSCEPDCDNHPIVCVDWCDAYVYCKTVGKRLCGKIGGGATGWDDYANASLSQWYNACSSGGVNSFPYGDTFSETACNAPGDMNWHSVPVASMLECQSDRPGFDGVHDLSGNVWEWEDSCNAALGQFDLCRARSGSYEEPSFMVSCAFADDPYRGIDSWEAGFRCCSP